MAKTKKVKERKGRKAPKTDGLGVREIAQIRSAIRQVWQRCHARALVIKRCTNGEGFARCESKACFKRGHVHPKIYVDHVERVGDLDGGFIDRLFVPSSGLQGLCKKCHDEKTKEERRSAKKVKTAKNIDSKDVGDFF